jgi:hypothetical protein
MSPIEFVSLNGPDNAGKSTQIRLLSEARPSFHVLGSAHQHAPQLWRVLPEDSATWWFETSTTMELSRLLLDSHRLRAEARDPRRVALLDRGHPMLVATAIATCAVKDGLSIGDALAAVGQVQRALPEPPAEFALLLLISRDVDESLEVSQARDPEPWNPRYLRYQRVLHEVLMQQVDQGVYDQVIEWGIRSRAEIHVEIVEAADCVVRDTERSIQGQPVKEEQ